MKGKLVLSFGALFCVLCLLVTGCNYEFTSEDYNDEKKIAQNSDVYTKVLSVFNTADGVYSLTADKFKGYETLWTKSLDEDTDLEIQLDLSIAKGQAKVVHIDSDGNVTKLIECTPDTSTDGYVTKTVSLKKGKNRLKIVGVECEELDLKITFEES